MYGPALQDESTEALIGQYQTTGDPSLRAVVIKRHEWLVQSLAAKFARAGALKEDLVQVGWVGLITALDRFDPYRGTKFGTYAIHRVTGEIRHYLRDHTWGLRIPRYLQELSSRMPRVEDELRCRLGRPPSVEEIATALGASEEEVLQAMELRQTYQMQGLDERRSSEDGTESLSPSETIGTPDRRLSRLVEDAPLQRALSRLDSRRQRILTRRYFEGRTQSEVADELGVSQMHVSRLERSALRQLRVMLCAVAGEA